jgi:hypothetical protein
LDPGMEKKIVIKNIIDHLVKSEYRVDINWEYYISIVILNLVIVLWLGMIVSLVLKRYIIGFRNNWS